MAPLSVGHPAAAWLRQAAAVASPATVGPQLPLRRAVLSLRMADAPSTEGAAEEEKEVEEEVQSRHARPAVASALDMGCVAPLAILPRGRPCMPHRPPAAPSGARAGCRDPRSSLRCRCLAINSSSARPWLQVIDSTLSDDDLTARIAELGLGGEGGVEDKSSGEVRRQPTGPSLHPAVR